MIHLSSPQRWDVESFARQSSRETLMVIKADCLHNAGVISDGEKQWVHSRASVFGRWDAQRRSLIASGKVPAPDARRRVTSGGGCILVTRPNRHL